MISLTLLIDCAGDDLSANGFVDRQALAGEHGFVDRRVTVVDDGVHRDALARLDQQQVARQSHHQWGSPFLCHRSSRMSGGFRRQAYQAS